MLYIRRIWVSDFERNWKGLERRGSQEEKAVGGSRKMNGIGKSEEFGHG